jgi:hypothetical protein
MIETWLQLSAQEIKLTLGNEGKKTMKMRDKTVQNPRALCDDSVVLMQ